MENVLKQRFFSVVMVFILIMNLGVCIAYADNDGSNIYADGKDQRVIVKFKDGVMRALKADEDAADNIGDNTYMVKVKDGESVQQTIDYYEDMPEVEYAEPDYIRTVSELNQSETKEWGLVRIGADTLQKSVEGNSTEVVVAVVDSGVYAEHPLLADRMLPGWDFVSNDSDPDDLKGHGTHVAGIIAQVAGKANVKILPVRVLNKSGTGYDSTIGQGIRYAVDNGADIINMSFGGKGSSYYLESAVKYAVDHGVIVIAAAGNEAENIEQYMPANIEECITVSALNAYDYLASFSNYGYNIDVAAPGVSIKSSVPLFADNDSNLDGYAKWNGTSMAAPFVAGAAALLKIDNPEYTADQIENLIDTYVDDIGEESRDIYFGYGAINFTDYSKVKDVKPISEAYKRWEDKPINDEKRTWTIKLNKQLTQQDISNDKIYVEDKYGTRVPVDLYLLQDNYNIQVVPRENYKTAMEYRLFIELSGLKQPVAMVFKMQ